MSASSTERLELLGHLAGRVSVVLRQPLTVLRNAIYYVNLHSRPDVDQKVRRHLGLALEAVEEIAELVANLDGLVGAQPCERSEVELAMVVGAALDRVVAADSVVLEVVVRPELRVRCDPHRLRLALTNIIRNAVEVLPSGGRVRVVADQDEQETFIEVADTGPGMDETVRARAFEPLFTTSPARLGIGLCVARQLAGACGGRVELVAPSGPGMAVRLCLPRHE
jgi:signal transduction histidine kinase